MEYISTRGGEQRLSFEETVITGLAPNGGLFIPSHIPTLPRDWATEWPSLSFQELALEIYSLFIPSSEIPRKDLLALINSSYSTFRHPDVAPLHQTSPNQHVLELFHGPTYAFKDVALQFLGNLFEYFLQRRNASLSEDDPKRQRLTVVGATSGDTGSAAIYGLRGKKDVSIFILYPKGRVSPIQEAQMTTVEDRNVFNLSVHGTFDDCQDIVKAVFADKEFNAKYRIAAINSINWARILAQIVYYFSSYFALQRKLASSSSSGPIPVQYVVPTGNFGDILAGFYAKKLGLPMGTSSAPGLVIATNSNDILTRFWRTGRYEKADSSPHEATSGPAAPVNGSTDGAQADASTGGVKETLSPAMDILVSSNFERLLYYLALETTAGGSMTEAQRAVNTWMSDLKSTGSFSVPGPTLDLARSWFAADRVDDGQTSATIRAYFHAGDKGNKQGYVVDPHTAVGLTVANRLSSQNPKDLVQIVLATAHPAKFSSAVTAALLTSPSSDADGSGFDFERDVLPEEFKGLLAKEKRTVDVPGIEVGLTKEVVRREVGKLFGVPRSANGTEEGGPSV